MQQDETAQTQPAPSGDAGTGDPASPATPEEAAAQAAEGFSQTIDSVGNSFGRFVDDPTFENAVAIFGPMLLELGQAIFALTVLVVIAMVAGRLTQKISRRGLEKIHLEPTVVSFIARLSKYAIWIIAIPIGFEIFGIKTTSLAAVIGAAGLAIGLALQGSLSNIAAGLMLLFLRPFKVGDIVEVNDELGTVDDVGIFYTRVYTFQRVLVYVPNSEVLSNKIENRTESDEYRADVPIGVAYGTDLAEAMEILNGVAEQEGESFKGRTNDAVLTDFGDSSINFLVRVWCKADEYYESRSRIVLAIDRALKEAEIEIPFPQRDLHVREPFSIHLREDRDDSGHDQRTHQDRDQSDSDRKAPESAGGHDNGENGDGN